MGCHIRAEAGTIMGERHRQRSSCMISTAVSVAIIIAIVGWLATIFAISRSSLSRTWKRNLLIPSWIPWLALALGAPILSGLIPLNDAFSIGGAMTTGMLVSIVIGRRSSSRQ